MSRNVLTLFFSSLWSLAVSKLRDRYSILCSPRSIAIHQVPEARNWGSHSDCSLKLLFSSQSPSHINFDPLISLPEIISIPTITGWHNSSTLDRPTDKFPHLFSLAACLTLSNPCLTPATGWSFQKGKSYKVVYLLETLQWVLVSYSIKSNSPVCCTRPSTFDLCLLLLVLPHLLQLLVLTFLSHWAWRACSCHHTHAVPSACSVPPSFSWPNSA